MNGRSCAAISNTDAATPAANVSLVIARVFRGLFRRLGTRIVPFA